MKKIKNRYVYFGAFIEAFDFCIFLIYAKSLTYFLTGHNSLVLSGLIFSISYIARPFGALFFGKYAENGKILLFIRNSPIWVAIPTILIAFSPKTEIGVYIFLFCRFIQGFIFGGECGLSFVFAYLNSNKYKISTVAMFLTSGAIAMSTCFFIIPLVPSIGEIESWRVAFLASGVATIGFVYFRRKIPNIVLKEKKSVNINYAAIAITFSNIIVYAMMFNVTLSYLTSNYNKIGMPAAMLLLSILSIAFAFILDLLPIIKDYAERYLTLINLSVFSIFIAILIFSNNQYQIFIFSYISCCTLGGFTIYKSIKQLVDKKCQIYSSFGLSYNIINGFLGALIPVFKGIMNI